MVYNKTGCAFVGMMINILVNLICNKRTSGDYLNNSGGYGGRQLPDVNCFLRNVHSLA
jgi:hypothetical protein